MNCPACGATLEERVVAEIVFDICPACAGAWFDGGELSALARRLRYDASKLAGGAGAAAAPPSGECPRCIGHSPGASLRGDPVGRCSRCAGAWVPPGALKRAFSMNRPRKSSGSAVPPIPNPGEHLAIQVAATAPDLILVLLSR